MPDLFACAAWRWKCLTGRGDTLRVGLPYVYWWHSWSPMRVIEIAIYMRAPTPVWRSSDVRIQRFNHVNECGSTIKISDGNALSSPCQPVDAEGL